MRSLEDAVLKDALSGGLIDQPIATALEETKTKDLELNHIRLAFLVSTIFVWIVLIVWQVWDDLGWGS